MLRIAREQRGLFDNSHATYLLNAFARSRHVGFLTEAHVENHIGDRCHVESGIRMMVSITNISLSQNDKLVNL